MMKTRAWLGMVVIAALSGACGRDGQDRQSVKGSGLTDRHDEGTDTGLNTIEGRGSAQVPKGSGHLDQAHTQGAPPQVGSGAAGSAGSASGGSGSAASAGAGTP